MEKANTDLFGDFWTFSAVWNKSLEEREERPLRERNNLWASELGKSPIDIFLKMKGTKPTNPPNPRSLRKFEAGNIWEWIVKLVLQRAGVLREEQKWVSYQYPNMLEVTGKIDFIAGGFPNFEKARTEIDALGMPDVFTRAFENILANFKEHYPNGLAEKVLEVKSVSAFMYDAMERTGKASQIHRLQCYHYLKATGIERGDVVYICKDDCRMMEIPVYLGGVVEEEYNSFIKKISGFIQSGEQPPKEQPIVWSDDMQKFATNFNVAYSGYLTMLYGFKDQMEFDAKYKPVVERWNRVLGRIKKGDKMTEKNLAVIDEMKAEGYDPETLVGQFAGGEEELPISE